MDNNLIDQILKEDVPEWEYDEFKMSREFDCVNYNGDNISVLTEGDDDESYSKINESVNQSGVTVSSMNDVMSVSSAQGTPVVSPQSLRKIQNPPASLIYHKTGRIIKHAVLTKVCHQISSDRVKVNIGSVTCCSRGKFLAIGTSKGLTFIFDLKQVLRFYVGSQDKGEQFGAVSSVSLNVDSSRLLVAFAKAHINMWDISGSEGKLLRSIDVNQGVGYAVSFVRFLPDPTMAVYSDTNGSVFQLSFKRGIAGRSTDLECFFSGSRGEIICLEPLFLPRKITKHAIGEHCLLAMSSFTKIIVVSSKPQLKVKFMYSLTGKAETAPQLTWSFNEGFKDCSVDHHSEVFLSFGRDNQVYLLKITCLPKRQRIDFSPETHLRDLKFELIFHMELDVQILTIKWLNQYFLAVIDFEEQFHAIDLQTKSVVETIDLRSVKMIYNTSLFKSTVTGGNVSGAMALVAEKACYHSVVEQNGQIKILGDQDIHLLMLRPWKEAIDITYNTHSPEKAFQMCAELFRGSNIKCRQVLLLPRENEERQRVVTKFSINLIESSFKDVNVHKDKHSFFNAMLDLCVVIKKIDYYTDIVYNMLTKYSEEEVAFIRSIIPLILNNIVKELHPELVQRIADYLLCSGQTIQLDCCIAKLKITCIDLDQIIKMSKKNHLFSAIIHVYNEAFCDYLTPINTFVDFIKDSEVSGLDHEIQAEAVIRAIVYIHCCLSGKDYFSGKPLPQGICELVKINMFEYLVPFGMSILNTPLDLLLQHNTNELLNMLTLAFDEDTFTTDIGVSRKQAILQRLCDYFRSEVNDTSKEDAVIFFVFLSRELSKSVNVSVYIDQNVLDELFEKVCLGIDDLLQDDHKRNTTDHSFLQKQFEMTFMTFMKTSSSYQQHWLESERVLSLARRAHLYKICEHIYRQKKMLHMVLECYLLDQEYKEDIFILIDSAWNDEEVGEVERSEILSKCFDLCEQLVITNSTMAVVVLLIVAKKRVEEVIEKLSSSYPKTTFNFLKSFFIIRNEMQEKDPTNDINSVVSHAVSLTIKALKVHSPTSQLFIDLLCRFDPDSLPIYLRFSVDYKLENAIRVVLKYDLPYSLGFLYEKIKKFEDACDVYVNVFNKIWSESIKEGEPSKEVSFISSKMGRDCQICINRFVYLVKKYKAVSSDVERIWMKMFNCIMDKKAASEEKEFDFILKAIFTQFVKCLSNEIPMPVVLITILKSTTFVDENFGKIKDLFIFMMNSFNYEKLLLESCISMINEDVTDCIMQLRTVLGNGVVVTDFRCNLCNNNIALSEYEGPSTIVTFRCGHRFHQYCLKTSKKGLLDRDNFKEQLLCSVCSKSVHSFVVNSLTDVITTNKKECAVVYDASPAPHTSNVYRSINLLFPDIVEIFDTRRLHTQTQNLGPVKQSNKYGPIKLNLSAPNYLLKFCK